MFDKETLYNLLASGHSSEDLVALFTSSLNEAEARAKEEAAKAAEEAATKERAAKAEAKRADFMSAIACLLDTINRHYPEMAVEVNDETTGPIADLVIMSADLQQLGDRTAKAYKVKAIPVEEAKKLSEEDVFTKFFKSFGLC